jgi:hypothetical protein
LNIDGLCEVAIEAGLDASFAIAVVCVCATA